MFPAARILDKFVCTLHPLPPPATAGGTIAPRVSAQPVRIGNMLAAREGDLVICPLCPPPASESIFRGEPTVRIEGMPAARVLDPTAFQPAPPVPVQGKVVPGMPTPPPPPKVPSGTIAIGCPTVRIGMSAQAATLKSAARDGTPFCEECEKAKKGNGP